MQFEQRRNLFFIFIILFLLSPVLSKNIIFLLFYKSINLIMYIAMPTFITNAVINYAVLNHDFKQAILVSLNNTIVLIYNIIYGLTIKIYQLIITIIKKIKKYQ